MIMYATQCGTCRWACRTGMLSYGLSQMVCLLRLGERGSAPVAKYYSQHFMFVT